MYEFMIVRISWVSLNTNRWTFFFSTGSILNVTFNLEMLRWEEFLLFLGCTYSTSQGRQHIACYVIWAALLSTVALWTFGLSFTEFKLFYFPNVKGLVQSIVRFEMHSMNVVIIQYQSICRIITVFCVVCVLWAL